MSFKDCFCPSPWFHMRITNSGHFEYCRWSSRQPRTHNIQKETPIEFFQQGMAPIRQSLLNGEEVSGCSDCALQEQHGKVNGRQRQLLKAGVQLNHFDYTMLSSPWLDEFNYSNKNSGTTHLTPQDWQIDLGNHCNSACIMCHPESSSRLAIEFKRIGLIDQLPKVSWCDEEANVQVFLEALKQSTNIRYLHFIGGETLITPAFRKILEILVNEKLNESVTIGFTTNLTVWDQEIVDLLKQFKTVHLGMSIECLDPLNDYVRYGSEITVAQELLEKWNTVAQENNWFVQLRITPTALTIGHLVSVYDYAYKELISVESCNFLTDPDFLSPNVLPLDIRGKIINDIKDWITEHLVDNETIINTRNPTVVKQQLVNDLQSYISYLEQQPDESHKLPALVDYLKLLELSRKNSILDYLPEYEHFLRSAGY